MRSEALKLALNPAGIQDVILALMNQHRHSIMLGNCQCGSVQYAEDGHYEGELAEHDIHQAAVISAELVKLRLLVGEVDPDALKAEVRRTLSAHRRHMDPARCACGIKYDQAGRYEDYLNEHDGHASAAIVGQLQIRGMAEMTGGASVTQGAVAAALIAMECVTPPPGISKRDWLQQWGRSALVAGGIAAALRATEVAAAMSGAAAEAAAKALIAPHVLVYPHEPTGLRLSCTCKALLDDFDSMAMTPQERHGIHLAQVIASAGWRPTSL